MNQIFSYTFDITLHDDHLVCPESRLRSSPIGVYRYVDWPKTKRLRRRLGKNDRCCYFVMLLVQRENQLNACGEKRVLSTSRSYKRARKMFFSQWRLTNIDEIAAMLRIVASAVLALVLQLTHVMRVTGWTHVVICRMK